MSRSFRLLLTTIAVVFALLFTIVAVGQYSFLRYQLYEETKNDLWELADEMRDQIAFADTWNLQGYRRTTEGPDIYLVIAENATLIDTHGYLKGMLSHVVLPFRLDYDRPLYFASDVNEAWNLYVHRLSDGIVILGARKEITPERVGEQFASNAARFGTTVATALRTPERAIDEAFDYAIIDKNGDLQWAIGGIPLKASVPQIPAEPELAPVRRIEDKKYAAFLEPVVSKTGRKVGLIEVLEDVTDEQQVLHNSAIFNALVAAILWSLTVAIAAAYLGRLRRIEITCAQIPFLEESDRIEFKPSLRWDYLKQKPTKEIERTIVKAVLGFLNSESGGTLIIGIGDRKEVLGLDVDYSTLRSAKPDLRPTGRQPTPRSDRDVFEQMLRQILINIIGERHCARWIKVRFCSLQSKDISIVSVAPASEPVFLAEEGVGKLYVRVGNSTRPFSVQEALAYARDRWSGFTLPRPHARPRVANLAG